MENHLKTALLTGACGGLGKALAAEHAKRGGNLILTDRNAERLNTQKSFLENRYGVQVYTYAADLAQMQQVQDLYRFCTHNQLSVDYLLCNAGFGGQGAFAARSIEKDMRMIDVNVRAVTLLCKLFLPDFLRRGSGKVLIVSSFSANMPGPLQAVYFASKAYLTSLGNALSKELQGSGVTLTTAMPDVLATEFAEKGHLEDTLLFSRRMDPQRAARSMYNAMLAEKINVYPCLRLPLRAALPVLPLLPKKAVLELVYLLQKKGMSTRSVSDAS